MSTEVELVGFVGVPDKTATGGRVVIVKTEIGRGALTLPTLSVTVIVQDA